MNNLLDFNQLYDIVSSVVTSHLKKNNIYSGKSYYTSFHYDYQELFNMSIIIDQKNDYLYFAIEYNKKMYERKKIIFCRKNNKIIIDKNKFKRMYNLILKLNLYNEIMIAFSELSLENL